MDYIRFSEFGTDLKFTDQAEHQDFPKIDGLLKALPLNTIVVFDLNNLEFLGYSYAKQTIRRSFRNFLEGNYKVRVIVLAYDGDDSEGLLDGVRAALAEQNLTMWLFAQGQWRSFGYLSTEGIKV